LFERKSRRRETNMQTSSKKNRIRHRSQQGQLWVRSKDALALLLERTIGRLSYDDALRLLAKHGVDR
jgi:hypothetical protein